MVGKGSLYMYDYKAEKLARIAAVLFGFFVILGCIYFLISSEEAISVYTICAILAILVYLAGLILAVIAKIKCKYSSFVNGIFRLYVFATCGLIIFAFAIIIMIQGCASLIEGLD